MSNITLERCFSEGLETFKKYPGLAIGGWLIYNAISAVVGNIPIIGPLYIILAAFPLAGGLAILFLNIVRGQNPEIGQLFHGFCGFNNWARWMGVGWLLMLYTLVAMLVCCIPLYIGAGIAAIVGFDSATGIFALVLTSLISAVAIIAVIIRWAFVYYLAADEGLTATQAIKRSAEMTEGIRPQILWITLVLSLFSLVGLLALGIGIIITGPIAQCGLTAFYLDVKQERGGQAAAQTPVV